MPDQDNIFNEESGQGNPQSEDQSSNTNLFANQLAGIRNPDGSQKYDSVDKALEGTKHAQDYITQLKSEQSAKDAEIAALKADLGKRESVEDVVSKLLNTQQEQNVSEPTQASGLSEEAVIGLVKQVQQESSLEVAKQTNEKAVNDSLISVYGDKAKDVLQGKAIELGIDLKKLQKLSQEDPQLVLALFEQKQSNTVTPSTSSVNIPGNSGGGLVLEPPTKSLLLGATDAEKNAYFAKCRDKVHADLGVTQ